MLIFSFRARAGRLSLVDLFFPSMDVASHVFVVSVMCIFTNPIPPRDPLLKWCFLGDLRLHQLRYYLTPPRPRLTELMLRTQRARLSRPGAVLYAEHTLNLIYLICEPLLQCCCAHRMNDIVCTQL